MEKNHSPQVLTALVEPPPNLVLAAEKSPVRYNDYFGLKRLSSTSVVLPRRNSFRHPEPDILDALKEVGWLPRPLHSYSTDCLGNHWISRSVGRRGCQCRYAELDHGISQDLRTRNICLVGLAIGWILAIASMCVGLKLVMSDAQPVPQIFVHRIVAIGYFARPYNEEVKRYTQGHRILTTSRFGSVAIPFVMSFVLTAVLDSMNFIHATSLRWALWHEGRLSLKSSLRLLTASRSHLPNKWHVNVLCAAALALAYGSISVMTTSFYIEAVIGDQINPATGFSKILPIPVPGPRYGLDFGGWGIVGLSIGLLVHAMVSSWCLISKRGQLLTWSSNPLACARACVESDLTLSRTTPSARKSWSSSKASTWQHCASIPKKQDSIQVALPSTRWVTYAAWLLFATSATYTIVVGIDAAVYCNRAVRCNATSPWYVLQNAPSLSASSLWQFYGFIFVWYGSRQNHRDWLGLIIQSVVQAIPSLGLHCVELLTQLTMDESVWREASKKKGAQCRAEGIRATCRDWFRWPSMVLFVFKSIVQYLFGSAFTAADIIIAMSLLPAVALSVSTLLLALFAEYLARRKPSGPQPATYGSIAALARLVDTWAETIWFGDKGEEGGIRIAGTVTDVHEVHAIQRDKLYFGLQGGIR